MDAVRAARIEAAVKMMFAECLGQPYDVRRRFGVLIPTLRGHKFTLEGFEESKDGSKARCEVCERGVKIIRDGTSVEGRATETDCPSADWMRY